MSNPTRIDGAAYEPAVGEIVACRTADGRWLRKKVLGPGGRDFPCWNVEWEEGQQNGPSPWPIEDVRPLAEHPEAMSSRELLDSYRGR